MGKLEARKVLLIDDLAGAADPAPRLHRSLAEVYRAQVVTLTAALAADDGADLREQVPRPGREHPPDPGGRPAAD